MADNFLEKHYAEYEAKRNAMQKANKLGKKQVSRLHRFSKPTEGIELPTEFTDPFNYTPHPLCQLAVDEVMQFIDTHPEWHDELQMGKMFGVLVVKNVVGKLGFLAAFSGLLNKQNDIPYFVPAVYDMLNPNGHFKTEERAISLINAHIKELEMQEKLPCPTDTLYNIRKEAGTMTHPSDTSQKTDKELISAKKSIIADLKQERKRRSIALQQWLFEQFVLLNARGERKNLIEIFQAYAQQSTLDANTAKQHMPPGGTGECAAPKLLQYAFLNKLQPVAMAEFWWGNSPKGEERIHGHFYPACEQKCRPILKFMLN